MIREIGPQRAAVAVEWAKGEGLLAGDPLDAAQLQVRLNATLPQRQPPQQVSSLTVLRERVKAMRARSMEIAAIRLRLREETGETVSYAALRRLVR